MQSKAKTVNQYIKNLPADRRVAISTVRKTILKNLPKECKEAMQYGMITYVVPLSQYPAGYRNDKTVPLPFISLASQKNHMSLYMMNIYGDKQSESWFKKSYSATGKKLNMGRSCVRFRKLENLPLDVIGKAVKKVSVKNFIKTYEKSREKIK